MDKFIVHQLSNLSDKDSEDFKEILKIKVEEVLEQLNPAQEYGTTQKKKGKVTDRYYCSNEKYV